MKTTRLVVRKTALAIAITIAIGGLAAWSGSNVLETGLSSIVSPVYAEQSGGGQKGMMGGGGQQGQVDKGVKQGGKRGAKANS